MTTCIVYGLCSSRDGKLRYIGQTLTPLRHRFVAHLSQSRRPKLPIHFWLRRELDCGFKVEPIVLCDDAVFNVTEYELISRHRAEGADLLNLTDGGGGQRGFIQTKEHVEKRAAAKRGSRHTDETKAKMAAAKLGKKQSKEHIANRSAALKGRTLSKDHAKKIADALRGIKRAPITDEQRRSRSLSQIGRKFTDEHKRKMSEAHIGRAKSAEHRAAMSLGWKARRENAATRI